MGSYDSNFTVSAMGSYDSQFTVPARGTYDSDFTVPAMGPMILILRHTALCKALQLEENMMPLSVTE